MTRREKRETTYWQEEWQSKTVVEPVPGIIATNDPANYTNSVASFNERVVECSDSLFALPLSLLLPLALHCLLLQILLLLSIQICALLLLQDDLKEHWLDRLLEKEIGVLECVNFESRMKCAFVVWRTMTDKKVHLSRVQKEVMVQPLEWKKQL